MSARSDRLSTDHKGRPTELAALGTLATIDPQECLALVGGVARRSALARAGVSDWALASARRHGTVVVPRRGVYALPGTDPVDVARVTWDCQPTCITAAARLGLPVMRQPTQLHMALAPTRSSAARHGWPPDSIKVHMSVRLRWLSASAADIIDASARCVTPIEQLAIVDAALNRGLMSVDDISLFTYTPKSRREWLARQCDSECQSPLETFARVALRRVGLGVETQVAIPGVGRVDMLVQGVIVVETDGRATHALESAFDVDRRRDRAAALAGYVVLRFGYRDVMECLPELVAEVQAAAQLWGGRAA